MTSITKDTIISRSSVNNNNVLNGKNVMPMKGQVSSNGNHFSMMRQIFQSTPKYNPSQMHETNESIRGKNALYQDNSLYLIKKKAAAMGKEQYSSTLSFNSKPKNDVIQAKKRVRSSGAVPPPKRSLP
tara:strand:- start:97 stop:480 length:384 start_codon:yes stop_codon:yes gene_type:complete